MFPVLFGFWVFFQLWSRAPRIRRMYIGPEIAYVPVLFWLFCHFRNENHYDSCAFSAFRVILDQKPLCFLCFSAFRCFFQLWSRAPRIRRMYLGPEIAYVSVIFWLFCHFRNQNHYDSCAFSAFRVILDQKLLCFLCFSAFPGFFTLRSCRCRPP